jgi:glycosyltransferase involved in cell wall biosynthesis
MKVLMLCGAITPDKGGGVASIISSIVKNTCSVIHYTIVSFSVYEDTTEIYDLYPASVEIDLGRGNLRDNISVLLSRKNKYDIIHVHGLNRYSFLPVFASALNGLRTSVIYSHHMGLEQMIKEPFKLSYSYTFFNIVSRGWRKVIVNSRYCARNELNRFNHLKHKIVLLPNGVDIDLIHNVSSASLEGNPAILFLGHPTYIKGIDILLKAFGSNTRDHIARHAHLHIVGSSDACEYYKEHVRRIGLSEKVHFWGYMTHSQALSMLKGSDIFVLPSRYENFPVVLLEAMAAGKPIIATNVGGIPEIIEDKSNGILVNPSALEIAEALKELIEHEEFRKTLGEKNTRDAEKFSWKNIADKYVDLYESLIR